MKRCFTLFLLALFAAGCGKNSSGPPVPASIPELPLVKPPSGGEMVQLPAGEFLMGEDSDRPDEVPHRVRIGSFFIDRYPVTQEQYQKFMGVNPSKRKQPTNPVERTQWTDAARFCNRCSDAEKLTPCYNLETWECNFEANGYRLPTEAEWEYACRAGTTTKYCCGDDPAVLSEYAWFKPHSAGAPKPVGEKLPNAWGLFDMHGNVWQWCNDFYSDTYYKDSPKDNPRGPASGKMRVLRGGAWDSTPDKCRSAARFKECPVFSDACFGTDSYGFRRVRRGESTEVAAIPVPPKLPVVEKKKPPEQPASPPTPTPDAGKIDVARLKGTIVFVSSRSGTLKIWRMRANGQDVKQLTTDANADADPRFSPDGKQILYTTLRGGFPEIWVMNRDGSAQQMMTKGSQACWSPNGSSILFIRDNQVFVRELASKQERRITPESWERCGVPAWRPDGKQIAVASRHLGNIGIFLLSLDGKKVEPLKTEQACCTPQWSADGKRMLCQTVQGHIHQVGVDGANWDQLTFGADVQHDARYSPDGSMILFCRAPAAEGPWQICLKKLSDDEEFVQLTKEGSNLLPDWHAGE